MNLPLSYFNSLDHVAAMLGKTIIGITHICHAFITP